MDLRTWVTEHTCEVPSPKKNGHLYFFFLHILLEKMEEINQKTKFDLVIPSDLHVYSCSKRQIDSIPFNSIHLLQWFFPTVLISIILDYERYIPNPLELYFWSFPEFYPRPKFLYYSYANIHFWLQNHPSFSQMLKNKCPYELSLFTLPMQKKIAEQYGIKSHNLSLLHLIMASTNDHWYPKFYVTLFIQFWAKMEYFLKDPKKLCELIVDFCLVAALTHSVNINYLLHTIAIVSFFASFQNFKEWTKQTNYSREGTDIFVNQFYAFVSSDYLFVNHSWQPLIPLLMFQPTSESMEMLIYSNTHRLLTAEEIFRKTQFLQKFEYIKQMFVKKEERLVWEFGLYFRCLSHLTINRKKEKIFTLQNILRTQEDLICIFKKYVE